MDPSHNINALLIGTGEFKFSDGAETAAESLVAGYQDFGNIKAYQLQTESQKVEHKGSYRGQLVKDKTLVTEQGISYLITCDEWDMRNLLILLGGTETTGFTQPAISALDAAAAWAFTADIPAKVGYWYDIQRPTGEKLMHLTSAAVARVGSPISCTADATTNKIADLAHGLSNGDAVTFDGTAVPGALTAGAVYYVVEAATDDFKVSLTVGGAAIDISSAGTAVVYYPALINETDFEVDLKLGMLRFTTTDALTSNVQVMVTSDVINAGDRKSMYGITPLDNLTRSGMASIVCFDQDEDNNLIFFHRDFQAELSVENAAEINSSDWSNIQLKVTLKGTTRGTFFVRESFEGDEPIS